MSRHCVLGILVLGLVGWLPLVWGGEAELVRNPTFRAAAPETLPTDWTAWNAEVAAAQCHFRGCAKGW